jgi:tRNA1(Val) A37 N6-methylase TrmN6
VTDSLQAPEVTYDALFGGAVRFWQPARGYRVNIDAILLAGFAAQCAGQTTLDLGSGVGAITLALHHLRALQKATLIECEPDLARLAGKNLAHVGLTADIVIADMEHDGLPEHLHGTVDLVVANPPFFEPGRARPAQHGLLRRARSGHLTPFVSAARRALSGKRACACFAYPSRSLEHLFDCARNEGLVAKRLRFVHSDPEKPARLCLIELRRANPGGLIVEAPLYEWTAARTPSPELVALTSGQPATAEARVNERTDDRS